MKNKKALYLGVGLVGALLVALSVSPIAARTVGWLYGEALRIASPIRDQTPDVTLAAGGAYIEGTLEVDGASRFDGTVTMTGNSVLNGQQTFGRCTTAGLNTLTPAASGYMVINITLADLCISSGSGQGAWVHLSTGSMNLEGRGTCH